MSPQIQRTVLLIKIHNSLLLKAVNYNDFIHSRESAQPVLPPPSNLPGTITTLFMPHRFPPHSIVQPSGEEG